MAGLIKGYNAQAPKLLNRTVSDEKTAPSGVRATGTCGHCGCSFSLIWCSWLLVFRIVHRKICFMLPETFGRDVMRRFTVARGPGRRRAVGTGARSLKVVGFIQAHPPRNEKRHTQDRTEIFFPRCEASKSYKNSPHESRFATY